MAPNPRRIAARLEEVYAKVPSIPDCQGYCHTSCGPIEMSMAERDRIRRAGVEIPPFHLGCEDCPALTADRRCSVYDLRPLVCRLWGAVDGMPCVYGCVPEGGRLSDEEAMGLMVDVMEIGGYPVGWDRSYGLAKARAAIRAAVEDPRVMEGAKRIMRQRQPW